MQLAKSKLIQIIKEELLKEARPSSYGSDQSWNQIIVDRAVSALLEATYDFDPPQEKLDILEAKVRDLLSDAELASILNEVIGANR